LYTQYFVLPLLSKEHSHTSMFVTLTAIATLTVSLAVTCIVTY